MDAKDHTESDQRELFLAKKREAQKRYRAKYPGRNAEICKKWQRAHPEKNAENKRAYWNKPGVKEKHKPSAKRSYLKRKYGLTEHGYEELLKSITRCPICLKIFKSRKEQFIDHCHETGIVRGVLCSKCNLAEGHVVTVDTARRLYEYMLRNEILKQGKN